MKRRRLTRNQRKNLFDDHNGICHRCGIRIDAEHGEAWHAGHIIALSLGGDDDLSNMRPEHISCNMKDAWEKVKPLAAKAARIRARHLGIKKKTKSWGYGRGDKFKKKVSGEVVLRETSK